MGGEITARAPVTRDRGIGTLVGRNTVPKMEMGVVMTFVDAGKERSVVGGSSAFYSRGR